MREMLDTYGWTNLQGRVSKMGVLHEELRFQQMSPIGGRQYWLELARQLRSNPS
jgi:hypothetical protein